ncbi:MAG: aminotransferase class IV [Candidatus Limnocylindrales bacterium]|jgi:branched-subunit amino acid aminotransferase/4-amino-4-deoxychorismate lyase
MTRPAASNVWLDGRLVPSDAAHISVYDRGFQLGDGVFEALRARRGVAIELIGHLARLHGGLAALAFEMPFDDDTVAAGVAELLAAEGLDGVEPPVDAVVRITLSRGFDPTRGVAPNAGGRATVAIQAWPYAPPAARALAQGERFITSRVHRDADSPISGIKTTSRAELVYARIEAERAGADDAIFLTRDGRITEATTSNVLLIEGDTCATPRLGTGLLAGTTRAWLVEHGDAVGLAMVERDLTLEDAFAADEMAICASIGGVIPVSSLDGRSIGDGKPGPRTIAMRAARERWIDEVSLEGVRARLAGR